MDQNNQGNQNNQNRRFIANVITESGQYGAFQKALVNNVKATNMDGTPNQYFKGNLLWLDAPTGKKYLVKQFKVLVTKNGKTSLVLDLDNSYQVEDLG